jgi:EAL domain-containing protein (putative c-di-GMP-specific phosphodiesterase class I)
LLDVPAVVERLGELRRLGVRIALDDFGTGYSTLSWLQRLPVDCIKIDRTFISDLGGSPAACALVQGILALAAELRIEVVAEGVETPEQLDALRRSGCRLFQGYLLGRPQPGPPVLAGALDAARL